MSASFVSRAVHLRTPRIDEWKVATYTFPAIYVYMESSSLARGYRDVLWDLVLL